MVAFWLGRNRADTEAIVHLSSRIAAAPPGEDEEEQALPYRQATAQRQ